MKLKSISAAAIVALMLVGILPQLQDIPKATALAERQEPTCQDGFGSPICVFLHPGIMDASKPGWSHTLDTVWGTQEGGRQRRQVFDKYLDYAVLSSSSDSVGDLQFDIQVLETIYLIELYVPPEFTWVDSSGQESVWTDITNDHMFVEASVKSVYDIIAPNWQKVRIGVGEDVPNLPSAYLMIEPGVYHIRLFGLRAPEVAGLYHFKIYVNGVSIGAGNFPIIVVKSELNPAWIEATVRTELYFNPPLVSGYVVAEGSTPEGRDVKAMGYWGPNEFIQNISDKYGNGGAEYRVWLFGLAEGTYTLTAYASGAVPKTTDRFSVLAGQSYHSYMTVSDSPELFVTIYSKNGSGELPWHNLWQLPYGTNNPQAAPDDMGPHRDILLELYNSNNQLAAFWASNALPPMKYFSPSNMLLGYHDDIVSGFAPSFWNRARAGLIPTKNSYSAHLVDNFDLKLRTRGYPSTQWDGHVPWDTADYVNGILNGQYTLEAFVTGYIMDQADAHQRSFVLAGDRTVAMDLRRSNRIEIQMQMPSADHLSDITTVTLTANDADGNERGATAFFATPAMSQDGLIDGHDASSINSDGSYAGGIVIEGWNAVFPNVGDSNRDTRTKDHGLNPTNSTHSAGHVSLAGSPYTVSLYMADMGIPYQGRVGTGWYSIVGGDPQISVSLSNSADSLSFTIRPAWLKIGLRSVDFQVPTHSRPWTFPGAEILVGFANTTRLIGGWVGILDPIIYGLVQDPGTVQGAGFAIPGNPFGAEGVTPFDVDGVNDAGSHDRLAVTYTGTDHCRPGIVRAGKPIYYSLFDPSYRSTGLPPGEYTLGALTYGYVMRRSFSVQVPSEGGAGIDVDLIEGGQIRVHMDFKNEGIATDFNGFVRVEVFNAIDELVGASIYGQAEPNIFTRVSGGGAYFDYDEAKDWMLASVDGYTHSGLPEPAQGAGFDENYDTHTSASHAQRAWYSSLFYGVPADTWAGYANLNPSDANRLQVPAGQRQAFDVYGFHRYYGGAARTWAGGWPTTSGDYHIDYGLTGSSDIPNWPDSGGGLYTVKVWAFDPYGPDNMFESEGASDDWRMYSMATELTDVQVPWGGATELFVTMNNVATLRGTVRWLDMFSNLRPLPWAQVAASPGPGFDSYSAFAYASGLGAVGEGSADSAGAYVMWLPAGSHEVIVTTSEAPGVWGGPEQLNSMFTVIVSDGWVVRGDTSLSHTEGVAVPELPSATLPIGLLAAVTIAVLSLRRRTVHKSI